MKASSISILIAVAVIAVILLISSYAVLSNVNSPLEQRQDKTAYTPKANVEIKATTFNGGIEIQPSTGSQIEVIYNVETPSGLLANVKTSTNETKTEDATTIITSAVNQAQTAINCRADLLIKVPTSSTYNFTLLTANGNIIKPQLNDNKISVSTSNGNIDIKDSNCSSIEAISMNGNVKIGLATGTLFQVAASVGNGNIAYQGIALNTSVQSGTRLKGATSAGDGTLFLTLMSANGNVSIEYLNQ